MVFARAQTQLDQRPRVGHRFALPALVGLVATHGLFAGLVPRARSFSAQVVFANQRFLNGLGSLRVNFLLAARTLLSRALSRRSRMRLASGFRPAGRFCCALVMLVGDRSCSRRLLCRSVAGRTLASGRQNTCAHHEQRTHSDQSCSPDFSPNRQCETFTLRNLDEPKTAAP